ncbi:MAG TPA: c-type cytochrome [Gemmatimonadales bacterium]|jgi:cytochrome c oxidase cbb3-type subunit 3
MKAWLVAALVLLPVTAGAQTTRPPEVTDAAIQRGAALFNGTGLCMACHGTDAKGIPNLGANLADDEWLHSDGSLAGILETLRKGVSSDRSSTGAAMPPRGGGQLSNEQLQDVAAYVWSLSHK